MTVVIGLTGSIGMGKSTTAAMFAEQGVPVWNADEAVHRLYSTSKQAISEICALCPDAVSTGTVDRDVLKAWIAQDPTALSRIEAVIHPLVAADREAFIDGAESPVVLLDIPLLFETGLDKAHPEMEIVTVSAPPEIQRDRVLERPGMTEAQFETILAKQMPDEDKRARSTYVIETTSLEAAYTQVQDVLNDIKEKHGLA